MNYPLGFKCNQPDCDTSAVIPDQDCITCYETTENNISITNECNDCFASLGIS